MKSPRLITATRRHDTEQVARLLAAGENPNAVDQTSNTALMWAAMLGYFDIVRLLLQCDNLDLYKQDYRGMSALWYMISSNNRDELRHFLTFGVDLKKFCYDQLTPLHATERFGIWWAFALLIEFGANVDETDWNGETTILRLASQATVDIRYFQMVIDAGADVNVRDQMDYATPLHEAARKGRLDMVRALVQAGADVDAIDYDNQTAYELAKDDTIKTFLRENKSY